LLTFSSSIVPILATATMFVNHFGEQLMSRLRE
jgi:hypothetical protein